MTTITPRCMGCGKKMPIQIKERHKSFYDRARFMCDKCTEEVMSSHSKHDKERKNG